MPENSPTTARTVAVAPHARPDLGREGVGVVKISLWDAATPDRQLAVLAAIGAAWRSRDWPAVGLLSYTVHLGDDGRTLLHYSQWTDEEAYERFFTEYRDERNAEIDAAVPGIARLGLHSYDLYRGGLADPADARVPGAVVAVEAEFDGPDRERAEAWVDGVLAALASDPAIRRDAPVPDRPHFGGISGWFHLTADGGRVFNYAEWESAEAHAAALAAPGEGIGSETEEWRKVHAFPGVRSGRVLRFTPGLSLRPAG
ncbi:antibiotic biosynthesis monooxygenase [Streptomyces qinzhouensis]|uniref:Antibiotic biosynthesis monooxygenase n=1 Tax=Streptomyces qinzhouensis TaxID=2599401 RepID=A0A5B8J8G0_9ACTN|nr:antibiotic biosynthesis monooxygenase [Streptomyces qinzhouensis]QDY76181.1 antibiotic biosynthesis monooxygenase [Streptomyces qinzhouensis]